MIYYERLKDGTIGKYTNNDKIAMQNGLNEQTTEEIISYDGKCYLQSEYEALTQTPEYKQAKAEEKQALFEKEFFLTSLGYIRRNVSMATGETKDFLSDLLPAISAGLQIGQQTPIITYKQPDFTQEFSIEYMESLQEIKPVTAEFVQECFQQIANDFMPAFIEVEVKE